MLAHYLLVATRQIGRHRFGTLVAVAGLALGLACFIGARLFALYIGSAERQFPGVERIHVLYQTSSLPALGLALPFDAIGTPLIAELLRVEYPEIDAIARSRHEPRAIVEVDGRRRFERVTYVEPDFLTIFTLDFVQKSARLEELARSVIVTEQAALSLFGTTDVVGRPLRIEPAGDIEIAAVIAPIPEPSHLAGTFGTAHGIFVVTRVREAADNAYKGPYVS